MNEAIGGVVEISFRDFTIPSDLLGEPSLTIEEGTRSRTSQAGTFNKGSGTLEEPGMTIPLFFPSWAWLGENIIRSRYVDGEGSNPGHIQWNASTCTGIVDAGPINVHYVCEEDSSKDFYVPNARLRINLSPTFETANDLMVELSFDFLPDENGLVWQAGSGTLDGPSLYNPETNDWDPVSS